MADLKRFDPFSSRLARDIRNGLSKSLLESITEGDVTLFQHKAAEYMEQGLDRAYQQYIQSRLAEYEDVVTAILRDHIENELQLSEILWDHGLYFEMHEILEKLWIAAAGDERKALQALIRAAGMKIHAENGNAGAAFSMGRKAQKDLLDYGKYLKGFSRLEDILADINDTLAGIERSP